jgi:tetratricopeptide (TPR) repeat protein
MAREVFTKKAFPKTHAVLCRRATDSVALQSNRTPSATALLLADIASEAGDPDSEMKHLSLYLQYKPDDALTWIRQINRQIQIGNWEDADQSLRKLKQLDRKHPAIPELSKKINSR